MGETTTLHRVNGKDFGPYIIKKILKKGGMGIVMEGIQKRLNRTVAIKIISAEMIAKNNILEQFFHEAEIMAVLDHPHILPIYDAGLIDNVPYMVTKFIKGGDLCYYVEQNGPMKIYQVIRLLTGLIAGVRNISHHGIAHRDIKPQNILIDHRICPFIMDFGLSVYKDSIPPEENGEIVGTPSCMSPERLNSQGKLFGELDDLYAVGATAFYALTGKMPFTGDYMEIISKVIHVTESPNPQDINKEIPDNLTFFIMKLMDPNIKNRFENSDAALEHLTVIKTSYEENQGQKQRSWTGITSLAGKLTKSFD